MKKERAVETAKKLLAMASGVANLNEAEIAAKRARKIIDQYQISLSDLEDKSELSQSSVGKSRKTIPRWENVICAALADLNDCIGSIENGQLTFKGFDVDVKVSEFMFFYMIENGKRQCREAKKHNKGAFSDSAFKVGYATQLTQRLIFMTRERMKPSSETNALVISKKQIVEAEFGAAKYDKKVFRSRDESAYKKGLIAGEQVNITTGLDNKNMNQRKIS